MNEKRGRGFDYGSGAVGLILGFGIATVVAVSVSKIPMEAYSYLDLSLCGLEPGGVCTRNWLAAFGTMLAGLAVLTVIVEHIRSRTRDLEQRKRFEQSLYLYTLPARSTLLGAERTFLPKLIRAVQHGNEALERLRNGPTQTFANAEHAKVGIALAGIRDVLVHPLWDRLFEIDAGQLREPHEELLHTVRNIEATLRPREAPEDAPTMRVGQSFPPTGWGTPEDIGRIDIVLSRTIFLGDQLLALRKSLLGDQTKS